MSQLDTAHAWWSRLRHQGLLVSPVVMVERYPTAPPPAKFPALPKLRDARTRFDSKIDAAKQGEDRDQAAILGFTDALLESFIGHTEGRLAKQHSIPENLTTVVRIGTRTETVRPHRVVFADEAATTPALLVMADSSPQVGRGRGRTVYSRFLELLRGTGHRLGLLTNGQQFRLVYAGLDFESWCEWESDRWFDEGEGTEELCGLRQLLSPESLKPIKEGVSGLLDGVEESRKRQADLSSVLRENVRQAIELLLEEVSTANRTKPDLFAHLVAHGDDRKLTDSEAHEAMFQATVRLVMRLVVCLFAESRQLLPINDPIYAQSYGVRSLYELLDEVTRYEGGTHALFNRQTAWHRLMALFRLIYSGSGHGAFPMRAYGGILFRPGDDNSTDAVARALHILEHSISVGDATIYHVLRKLLRGPLPVIKGKSKTFVDGPVDYTDLRTEFIGLIYEGLLDYRLKRTDEQIGPQIFLNLGREPVLPLARLEDMLQDDKKGLKDLLTTLRKEKVTATAADEEGEAEEDTEDEPEGEEETTGEPIVETEEGAIVIQRTGDYLDSVESAKRWAMEAVVLAALIGKQKAREPDSEYLARIEVEASKLIKRVVATGEFYLVRAGNIRKGTGTHYTRPQLAVPTVHRTLEPLCYDKSADGTLIPKRPEVILSLKVCDSSCGSASFLVAALHYMTDALYKSLCYHCHIDDPAYSKKVSLPYGLTPKNHDTANLLPFPPNDPNQGHRFEERVKALLRRHVVERCIYGVDINPLAVELARVSLWVETLDPELPFSFLDHKIKVGNSLVGCWLDRVEDYPLKAWEREGGDSKEGPRTLRIEEFLKGEKIGNRRSGDGRIKKEMRQVIESRFSQQPRLFTGESTTTESIVALARTEYEQLHDMPIGDPDERERFYRDHIERSKPLQTLTAAMNEWCAVWFWPTDEESLRHAPTPLTFHKPSVEKDTLVERLAQGVKFFHWEMEFPDVFTPERNGFDAMVGNPPWDVMKPNSQEFFTEFDPLYRTYDKQAAIRKQKELFENMTGVADVWDEYNGRFKALGNWANSVGEPFDMPLSRGKTGAGLATLWAKHRGKHVCYANPGHPFRLQGSADLNLYKLFTELFWNLLKTGGRLGIILPTGIYSDLGTKDLRSALLSFGTLDYIYAFQNEKRIFSSAHHAMKQSVVISSKGGKTASFFTRFRMGVGDSPEAHEIPDDILRRDTMALVVTPDDLRNNSPNSLSLIELRSERDLSIFRTIGRNSYRLGQPPLGWEITYAREFDMTSDSKHFPPLEKWTDNGFSADVLGRFTGPQEKVAVPFFEGRMIGQHDCSQKGWVKGKGRTAVWRVIPFDNKTIEPQYLMPLETLVSWPKANGGIKIAIMDITSSTNTRSMISVATSYFPFGHSAPVLTVHKGDFSKTLFVSAVLNSFVFDFAARPRVGGVHFTWFVLDECPLPRLPSNASPYLDQLATDTARLALLHRRFAPEWLKLRHLYPNVAATEWKRLWAVTEADRLRLRVEIDALCAELYGLTPDDFDWIVRDDPKDSKGFYRVDRQLPFRERLTGLAAAAFRALKDGKWSAESTARLSNDEFFEIIGIPEITTGPEPLIRKRNGCHVWKPEEFGQDDLRYGWTWDDCWKDAVALLGSEEAVHKYIEGDCKAEDQAEDATASEYTGPKDLFGNPIPVKPKQKKMF
jgi:hypothetical protein